MDTRFIDPLKFSRVFWPDLTFYKQQEEIIYSVIENDETYVPAGNELGKDFVAGFIALWWFCSRRPARVVTTSVKMDQLEDVLWGEIRRFIKLSAYTLPIQYNHMKIRQLTDDGELYPNAELVGQVSNSTEGLLGRHSTGGFKPVNNDIPRTLVIFDEACHDDQTEVMTENGWCKWKDVQPGIRLMSMNQDTQEVYYAQPTAIRKSYRDGEMILYQTKGADICVTPNHKMWRHTRNKSFKNGVGPWSFVEADKLSSVKHHMLRTVKWVGENLETFELPAITSERKTYLARSLNNKLWVKFLAWYCSEGNLVIGQNGIPRAVSITQQDPVTTEEIFQLCLEIGFTPKLYDNQGYTCYQVRIHDTQLATWLAQWGVGCTEKRIPTNVRMACPNLLKEFIQIYIRGDGYDKQGSRSIIYTSSKRMAADLQELVLKAGGISRSHCRAKAGKKFEFKTHTAITTADAYEVSVQWETTNLTWIRSKAKRIQYKGMVYCATLPKDNLLLTRRNGYCVWSGNSGIDDDTYKSTQTWAHRKLVIGNPFPCNNFFRKGVKDGNYPRPCPLGEGGCQICVGQPGKHGFFRKVIRIRAEDSPNIRYARIQQQQGIAPTGEVIVPGVKSWHRYQNNRATWDEMLQTIGLDAEFYEGSEVMMFPPAWIAAAHDYAAWVDRNIPKRVAKGMGVDPAEGGDQSVWSIVDEWGVIEIFSMKTPDTMVIPMQTLALMKKYKLDPSKVCFDRGGGGKIHADSLREQGYEVRTVAFGESVSPDPRHGKTPIDERKDDRELRYAYFNRRAELYGEFRELLKPKVAIDLAKADLFGSPKGWGIPAHYKTLVEEILPIPLTWDKEGRLKLLPKNKSKPESKERTLVELIGHSPDEADATALAIYAMRTDEPTIYAGAAV